MIRFSPKLGSLLWEHKTQHVFDSMDDLKQCIADKGTRFCHYIGKDATFSAEDVHFRPVNRIGWTNCNHVILGERVIGYCGE